MAIYEGQPINGEIPAQITIKVKEYPFSLTYMDLLTYVMPELSLEKLTPAQTILKAAAAKVSSFSVITYTTISTVINGITNSYTVDSNDVYDHTSINGHALGDFAAGGLKALALYNITGLSIKNGVTVKNGDKEVFMSDPEFKLYFRFPKLQLDDYGEFFTDPVDLFLTIEAPEKEPEPDSSDSSSDDIDRSGAEILPPNPYDSPIGDKEVPEHDIKDSSIKTGEITVKDEFKSYIYINSVSLDQLSNPSPKNAHIKNRTLTFDDNYVRIHFNEKYMEPMDFSLHVTLYNSDGVGGKIIDKDIKYEYTPNLSKVSGNEYPRIQKMNTPNVSYALLRTNPKLTGNVKVVVDSKNNIYLDTFKVSTSLEQKRFRHVKVNSNEYYGQTLMTKYKDVPTTDFYKIEDKCYNLFTTAQTYNSQYYDLYRYGVKTNDDKMYSENFALLAPLCIKEVIPDFFVVFKVDTASSDYDESWDDTKKMKYFLKNGKVVKSYDMRKDSILGEYVRTIYNRSTEYPGDGYLSYSETNHNRFIGISVERGVVTPAYESTFLAENIQSQVAMNDFITQGFERNHLVSKNIINFEFMFNDTDEDLFSISTYFGMYIRVNTEDEDFSCIERKELISIDEDSGEETIEYMYEFDSSVHTFPMKEGTLSGDEVYSNYMYALTTPKEFIRLNEGVNFAPQMENYLLKPYKNILSTEVKKINSDICSSFLTFKLNRLLEIGDHIRIVDVKNQTIYEVVTTNVDNYTDDRKISDVTTAYNRIASSFYTIKYVSITIQSRKQAEAAIGEGELSLENPMMADVIQTETEQLFYAFKKFNSPAFAPFKFEGNTITILGKVDSLMFERICSPSGFTEQQKAYLTEDDTEDDTIEFFNGMYANKIILNIDDLSWQFSKYVYLYPLYFEVVGNRMAHAMAFMKLSNIGDNYIYSVTAPADDIFDYKTLVYDSYDSSGNIVSTKYEKIPVVTFKQDASGNIDLKADSANYIPSFYNDGNVFLNLREPYLQNNTFNLYNSYPLNSGICSFFNLKDFDFEVLDNESKISASDSNEEIGNPGEFTETTIFNEVLDKEEDMESVSDINDRKFFYYNVDGSIPEDFYPINTAKIFYHTSADKHAVRIMNQDGSYPVRDQLDWDNIILYHPLLKGTSLTDYSKYLADYVFQYAIYGTTQYADDENGVNTNLWNATQILNGLFYIPHEEGNPVDGIYPSHEPSIVDEENVYTVGGLSTSVVYYTTDFEMTAPGEEDIDPETEEPLQWWQLDANQPTAGTLDGFFNLYAAGRIDASTTRAYVEAVTEYNLTTGSVWDDSDIRRYVTESNSYRSMYDYITPGNPKQLTIWQLLYVLGGWDTIGALFPNPTTARIDNKYSSTTLRTSSEENIKDYIDKHRSFYYDKENDEYDITKNRESTKYFNNLFENNHIRSDISLTSPHACKWKGVGTDARGESMRVMHDFKIKDHETGEWVSVLNDASSYFASGTDTYSNYLGFLSYPKKSEYYPGDKKYISGSLNSLTRDPENPDSKLGITEKQYILSGNGSLEDILYSKSDSENRFSVAYNAGEDMIEFISSGVKFRLKTNNNDALNLNNYNGYSAVFVSLPDVNRDYPKSTELIIDEIKKEIMLIWYQPTNTFKFGKVYENIPNNYDLLNSIFFDRYVCRISHEETLRDISCISENNINLMLVKDEAGYQNEPVYDRSGNPTGYFGKRLCRKEAGIWLGSIDDNLGYSKYNHIVLTGELYPYTPELPEDSSALYGYYSHKNYLTAVKPYLWHNEFHELATNTSIHNYCHDYNPSIESFLITDDPTAIPNKIGSFSDLKNAVNSCSIFVKTAEGKKDYTTFDNLLNITVIEPIKYIKYEGLGLETERPDKKKEVELGYVHPSYIEPVTIDMFNFNYNAKPVSETSGDEESSSEDSETQGLEELFEKSFDGGNIVLSKVNPINQIWFNKYTEEFNYCIKKVEKNGDQVVYKTKTSLGFDHNISIMKNSWNTRLYRNYSTTSRDVEQFEYVAGYKTGYELKTFIYSRGINLNGADGNTVEITSWKNTEISSKNGYIRLDITDSLVYNILFRDAFNKYWKYLNLSDNTYKINYIKNTILPLININNKTKFVLYKSPNLTKSLVFNSELNEDEAIMITNYKNELKYENGKYYMYVYPEETSQYYAKMIINL